MPKSFHKYKRGTKKKAVRIARRMNALCLTEESNGHGATWTRDECDEMMFLAMETLEIDYDTSFVKSWFRKVRRATYTRDDNGIYLMPPLDLVRDEYGLPCYKWLRNGECPTGFLAHLTQISKGLSSEIFDDLISLAASKSDELIEKLGAETALLAVIEARKTAYFLHRGEQLDQFLFALTGLEKEIASRLDRDTWNAGQEFMKLLPSKS